MRLRNLFQNALGIFYAMIRDFIFNLYFCCGLWVAGLEIETLSL
jgi:hypothetical protein